MSTLTAFGERRGRAAFQLAQLIECDSAGHGLPGTVGFFGMRGQLLTTAALLGLTASAYAADIDVTNVQVPYGLYNVVLTGGTLPGASPYNVYLTGQIQLTTTDGVLGVWCVDLFHDIYLGGNYTNPPYMTGPLQTNNTGSSPATSTPLTQAQIDEISVLAAWGNGQMASAPSDDYSAAIQAAIWDVEFGSNASYSGDTGFGTDLSYIESNVPYATYFAGGFQLSDTGDQGQFLSQSQFSPSPPGSGTLTPFSTPEPSTWAMMLLGFAGLGFAGYRKAKTTRTALSAI